jgi:hypothetical protein
MMAGWFENEGGVVGDVVSRWSAGKNRRRSVDEKKMLKPQGRAASCE